MSDSEGDVIDVDEPTKTIAERFIEAGMKAGVARELEVELKRRRDETDGNLWRLIDKLMRERCRALDWKLLEPRIKLEKERLRKKHTNHDVDVYCNFVVVVTKLGLKRREAMRLLNVSESRPSDFLYYTSTDYVVMRLQHAIIDVPKDWWLDAPVQ